MKLLEPHERPSSHRGYVWSRDWWWDPGLFISKVLSLMGPWLCEGNYHLKTAPSMVPGSAQLYLLLSCGGDRLEAVKVIGNLRCHLGLLRKAGGHILVQNWCCGLRRVYKTGWDSDDKINSSYHCIIVLQLRIKERKAYYLVCTKPTSPPLLFISLFIYVSVYVNIEISVYACSHIL